MQWVTLQRAARRTGRSLAVASCLAGLVGFALGARAQDLPRDAASISAAQGARPSGLAPDTALVPPSRPVEVLRSTDPAPPPKGPSPAAAPGDRPAPTDFQQYAATSVGSLLPVFGQELFARAPSTFAAVDDLPGTAEYVVGPGDELVIRGWGQVELDVRAVVSRDGTISIPRVGVVPVSGTRFQELPARLKAAVGRLYKNFELSVSLGRLRSIQVFVVGQTLRPGLYTVGSLSTLLNALLAAGGPGPAGSMRRIQLRRGDKLVGELDLYDVLLKGDKSKDLRLQPGDVIFVPPAGPVAAIAGRVKTPAVYELKDDACPLSELLSYAGGLATTADARSLVLERLDQQRGRVVSELPWSPAALATTLKDGDVVLLRSVSQRWDNAVTLRGNVAFPIRTEWKKGLTVADLIPDYSVLVPESYWVRTGARSLGDPRARTKPDLEALADEVNWDYALVERLDRKRLEPLLIPFNLRKALVDRDPAQNLELEAGDVVTIFSQRDIQPPVAQRAMFVRLEGEVERPGIYQIQPGETLRQLVERLGRPTRNAYFFGAEFTRESVRRDQQLRLDEVALRAERELDFSVSERLARSLSAEDAAATRAQAEIQRSTIARLRSLKATGRVVLGLRPAASAPKDLPEIVLEDGDRFYVPPRYSMVGVYGAVYNQSAFLYSPDKKVDDYLEQAGGATHTADAGNAYVLRADGSVISRRQSGFFSSWGGNTLMPNDAIVVPEEYNPISWVKELKDWSQIFYQFGLGVAAIKILAQ